MVVRRGKKSRYMRGSRTHGWGRTGQHRKSGRKGGRGRAGYKKHKWTWVLKYAPNWFGKRGFTRHPSIVPTWKIINVGELDEMSEKLAEMGMARAINGVLEVNLLALGVNKLTGRGAVRRALLVKTLKATRVAIRKVEEAGGKVILLQED